MCGNEQPYTKSLSVVLHDVGALGADEGEGSDVDSAAGMMATAMANLEARTTAILGAGQFNVAQGGVQVNFYKLWADLYKGGLQALINGNILLCRSLTSLGHTTFEKQTDT